MAAQEREKRDVRQEVTDRVIQALEQGAAPWQQPFEGGPRSGPVNAVTGKPYTGGNHIWLAMVQPTSDPRWCTFHQAKAAGWMVKKGEHGVPIEVWKTYEKDSTVDLASRSEKERAVLQKAGVSDGQEITEQKRFAKTYTVFHASQIDGIPPLEMDPAKNHEFDLHAVGEKLFDKTAHSAPVLFDSPGGAVYNPKPDEIHLPPRESFMDAGHLYATTAHEIAHSTMHPTRLNRERHQEWENGTASDKTLRAREELRAEMASYMLSEKTGIPHHPDNQATYVAGWLSILKEDKNELYCAARDAEKIANYVIEQQKLIEIAPQEVATEKAVEPEKEQDMEKQIYHKVYLTHRTDLKDRVLREPIDPDKPILEVHNHPRQEISGVLKDFSKSEFILEMPEFGQVRVETGKSMFNGREDELRAAVGKPVDIALGGKGTDLSLAVHQGLAGGSQGVSVMLDRFETPAIPFGLMPSRNMGALDAQPITGKMTHIHDRNIIELQSAGKPSLVYGPEPDKAHQTEIAGMIGKQVTVSTDEKGHLKVSALEKTVHLNPADLIQFKDDKGDKHVGIVLREIDNRDADKSLFFKYKAVTPDPKTGQPVIQAAGNSMANIKKDNLLMQIPNAVPGIEQLDMQSKRFEKDAEKIPGIKTALEYRVATLMRGIKSQAHEAPQQGLHPAREEPKKQRGLAR